MYVFVGILDVNYLCQLPYVWYYVGVKSSFQHAREKYESNRAYYYIFIRTRCQSFQRYISNT